MQLARHSLQVSTRDKRALHSFGVLALSSCRVIHSHTAINTSTSTSTSTRQHVSTVAAAPPSYRTLIASTPSISSKGRIAWNAPHVSATTTNLRVASRTAVFPFTLASRALFYPTNAFSSLSSTAPTSPATSSSSASFSSFSSVASPGGECRDVYLALGSNLGNRASNLKEALHRLRLSPNIKVLATSPMYISQPQYVTDQPTFFNAAVRISTSLSPHALLATLKQIEDTMGREPTVRNGPRIIDLDVVIYGSTTLDNVTDEAHFPGPLTLPHARMHERRFVLEPLAAVMALGDGARATMTPSDTASAVWKHPRTGQTIADLLKQCQEQSPLTLLTPVECTEEHFLGTKGGHNPTVSSLLLQKADKARDSTPSSASSTSSASTAPATTTEMSRTRPSEAERVFDWGVGQTQLMVIINTTPDSFSDGGRFEAAHAYTMSIQAPPASVYVDKGCMIDRFTEKQIRRIVPAPELLPTETVVRRAVLTALVHVAEGAHIIDVGGQSSRPLSEQVDVDVEIDRVVPLIKALRQQIDNWGRFADGAMESNDDDSSEDILSSASSAKKMTASGDSGASTSSSSFSPSSSTASMASSKDDTVSIGTGSQYPMHIMSYPNPPLISIDTYVASVAEAAVQAGAHIVNDISGGLLDPEMLSTIARLDVPYVITHMRGTPRTMQTQEVLKSYSVSYVDSFPTQSSPTIPPASAAAESSPPVRPNEPGKAASGAQHSTSGISSGKSSGNMPTRQEVIEGARDDMGSRLRAAAAAGIPLWNIIVDPGVGFAKTHSANLYLTRHPRTLLPKDLSLPILIGPSRKSYLGRIISEQGLVQVQDCHPCSLIPISSYSSSPSSSSSSSPSTPESSTSPSSDTSSPSPATPNAMAVSTTSNVHIDKSYERTHLWRAPSIAEPAGRDIATAAAVVAGVMGGANIARVHDVWTTRQAVAVIDAMKLEEVRHYTPHDKQATAAAAAAAAAAGKSSTPK